MKKLLGGIFARSPSAESTRAALTPTADANTSAPKRWGAFLLPSAPPQPSTADPATLKHLDAVMRGVAAHVKAVIAKSVDGEEHSAELLELVQFVEKLQQQSNEPSLDVLRSYLSWTEGIAFCEQTAFPSLVLDFVSRMRAFAMKEELQGMLRPGGNRDHTSEHMTGGEDATLQEETALGFAKLVSSLELLMNCVLAIASNETLMDTFRCELPNLLALTAEEYPPTALFIRDFCGRSLISVSDRAFNASLAWYLLDCNTIPKSIQVMTNYALATITTPETAARALERYQNTPRKRLQYDSNDTSIDNSAAAAAVSDALGLSRIIGGMSDRDEVVTTTFTSSQNLPPSENFQSDRSPVVPKTSDIFCLPCYDVRVGLKAVVYVLEKTQRFTPVLLDAFQTSGGYTLLLRLLDTCNEEEIPTFLDLLTSLMLFGPRSSDANDSTERLVNGNVFCARNVNAFAAMRDLLLNYIAELGRSAEPDTECSFAAKRRNENLILLLLTNVLHVYTSDYDNFVFLEPKTRSLALLLTKLPFTAFLDAQVIILRIVEYVCCSAKPDDPLPHEILSIVCGMLVAYGPLSSQRDTESSKAQNIGASLSSTLNTPKDLMRAFEGPSTLLSTLMCECLMKILRNCEADRYKQELSGFGLMDRGIYLWLEKIATFFTSAPVTDVSTLHEHLTALKPHLELYGNVLCLMLRNNARECIRYRESRIYQSLYVIIEALVSGDLLSTPFDEVRSFESSQFAIVSAFVEPAGILRSVSSRGSEFVSSTILLQTGVESDLSFILELLQRFRGAVWRQILLLYILMDTLKIGGLMISSSWKGCQGYEIILATLSSVDLAQSDTLDRAFQMMDLILVILRITLCSQHNVEYFKSIDGYSTVASCIITSGVLDSAKKETIIQRILEIIVCDAQQPEILNGDAVQIIFCLLPILPSNDAVDIMAKLLSMLETAGDTSILRRKEQVSRLVRAGALQWIQKPKLIKRMLRDEDPLKPFLVKWIVSIVLEEDLPIPRLQDFLEIAGKTMPELLGGHICAKGTLKDASEVSTGDDHPEVGLLLLQAVLRNPAVRHVSVGKPQGTEQTGRYVHIVNSADRVWPPSSGYSFSCWLRFPGAPALKTVQTDATAPSYTLENNSVSVALCEGYLSLTPAVEDEGRTDVYGVLVGTTLTLFSSSDCAAQNQEAIAELEVSKISRAGPLDWSIFSTTGRYLASCVDASSMEMWWRAIEQSGSFTGPDSRPDSDDTFNASFGGASLGAASTLDPTSEVTSDAEEGSACIVSIYSLESSGCFVRAFFEQFTGLLRFNTGAVSSGPSINANPKHTSVVFESVAIGDLRSSLSCSDDSSLNSNEINVLQMPQIDRKRDWHHFAFTHRKAVVGSSVVTVYIDGREVATKKLNFPSAPSAGSYQAFVGSDAQVCSPHSALSWKAGPMWLTDEVVSSRTIAAIFSLGPTFAHQFSGHAYRSVGEWPEALASSHLARAADRGIEISQFAQRLQLSRLGRSCRRQWLDGNDLGTGSGSAQNASNDIVATGTTSIAESMIAKKEELAEGLRLATSGVGLPSRKMKNKVVAFRNFISYDCSLSSFGGEIEYLLGNAKLPADTVLFTLNTSCSDRSSTPVLVNTQAHYINCAQSCHLDLARSLPYVGGITQVLFPLLDRARHQGDFYLVLKMLANVLRRNPACLAECIGSNGYAFIAALLCKRVHLINEKALRCVVRLAQAGKLVPYAATHAGATTSKMLAHPVVVNVVALTQVVLSTELRKKMPHHLQCQLISLLMDLLVVSNPNAVFNARQLRRAGLLQWILTYLSELGNEECDMDPGTALEMRWCFPKFTEPTFEAILQYALSLLRAFLRIESHADDLYRITEVMLLSMTSTAMHSRDSPIRVILLQFVLHEIENDSLNALNSRTTDPTTKSGILEAQRLSDVIIEAILHREGAVSGIKRRVENGNSFEAASLGSPIAESNLKFGKGISSTYPVDGFASVLLDVIDQDTDNGRWISAEALLGIRILLSLAQLHVAFAEHLLCKTVLMGKLKRVLLKYSTDCCVYTPLLAYVFSIPVANTSYDDPDTLSATDVAFCSLSLPPPFKTLECTEKCVGQVWDLIGELLLQNCQLVCNPVATEVNVNVLAKLAYQVKASSTVFASMCKSSGTIFRIIVQCLCACLDNTANIRDKKPRSRSSQTETGSCSVIDDQSAPFERLSETMRAECSGSSSIADACVNLTQTIMIRALSGSGEFGSLMMLYLETLDESILRLDGSILSRVSGQKFWLALLDCIIEKEAAITTKCELISMKNVCTVCVALARYLADGDNHSKETAETVSASFDSCHSGAAFSYAGNPERAHISCFGEEAFRFLVRCCKICAEPTATQVLGADVQQFFYGAFIYSAQTVLLNELGGAHKNEIAPPQLLSNLVEWKHILLEQPSWQGLVICGTLAQSSTGEVTGGLDSNSINPSSGRPRRMHRARSLSANAQKEFGIGTESDRSFILSLASLLFRMLMDDAANVRHTAIVMWQFLIDQRFNVLKELLIAEPRTSLLHTITSTKKEAAVDIFHGGFDRLLYALHTTETQTGSSRVIANSDTVGLNQEIWCQFQLWLGENNALLTDLLVAKTDTIYRHVQDVLLSCISLQKLPSSVDARETLQLNFPVRLDVKKASQMNDGFESELGRRDMIAKKAVVKFSSLKDSALESMNDGLSQWHETSLRLANTRNIWRMGRWQTESSGNFADEFVAHFEEQRSLFQRRALGYRLDITEGPQRMRLRLIRDYFSKERPKQNLTENNENQPGTIDDRSTQSTVDSLSSSRLSVLSKIENLESEIFRRSLEFHEAVEVFREFVYQQSITTSCGDGIRHTLENILSRCKLDSTQEFFSSIKEPAQSECNDGELTPLTMARLLYTSFLEGLENNDGKRTRGISPSILADIDRFIQEAGDNLDENPIQSTMFDAADAEATQHALCSVREESFRSMRGEMPALVENGPEEERDGSDYEAENETPIGSGNLVDDVESDDSDDGPADVEQTIFGPEKVTHAENEGGTSIEVSLIESTSPKAEQNKQMDTSSDAVYGAVARFLRRDDYPPMRSYNATYIAGMGGIPGLFIICRSGLYFIGGYGKLFNDLIDGDAGIAIDTDEKPPTMSFSTEGGIGTSQPNSQSGKLTSTPTAEKRKTTKTILRAALTDLGFSQSKASGEQFFTVVPLTEVSDYPGDSIPLASSFTTATSSRWSIKYLNVKQFCRIKYQLRPVGIEFFDTFGSTYFLQLETSADREEVVKSLFQMPLVNSIFWSPVFRTGSLVPSSKRIRQAVTKRWLRGSMSNFEYLIHLNTLAGRSFNDITQYPVFPWVVADYTSEFLDLDTRDTFRDLSKPMGALGPSRAAQFSERYTTMNQDMDVDDSMGTPAFHYGTHYSCSAYVINYLIRLEPFTALALELQGGVFDHPDRLFRSVSSSWASASRENLQDVRELIPEFFYLPEFLYNANDCVFGTTQSGEEVCHVMLPPWAHGDPREFVRLNRRALESKYVSEHLHEWIDLVFGSKQTGQAAVDAQNVFMHFTYEGTVDIDKISDPIMRTATLAQIENFGQTPSRLFSNPHPQRKVPTLLAATLVPSQIVEAPSMNPSVGHQYDGITLSTIEAYVKWHMPLAPALVSIGKDYVFMKKHSVLFAQLNGGAVGDVKLIHDKMQCQGFGCTFMPPRFAKYLDWGNNGGLMKLRAHQHSAARYREGNKVLAVIEGAHHDGVNCAAVTDDGTLLVTGGQDAVVNLIECSKTSDGRRIFKQAAKLVGHTDFVVCVAINKELNLIASSSADRSVLVWDLRTRALLQELAGHIQTVTHVSINGANGNILTTTLSELRLWSINGDLLAASSSSAFGLQAITCAISTRCESWQNGVIAVTGHTNGAIALWGLRYPGDLARQNKDTLDAETVSAEKLNPLQSASESGVSFVSPSNSKRTDLASIPVSVSSSPSARKQVVPSCQLFILKLLLDHRTKVTALTLGPEQRQLLSGDAEGNCIRWVDDSISTNIH